MKTQFDLPIFKIGDTVYYDGTARTVEQIFIKRCDVFLRLSGVSEKIRSDMVKCELTHFEFNKED